MLLLRRPLYQFGVCLVLSVSCLLFSQTKQSSSSAHDVKATHSTGRSTFNSSCAGCHGLDGSGSDKAVNISDSAKVRHLSDAQLSGIISNGISGTGMPAFHNFDEKQVRAIVGYLRSLQGKLGTRALPGDGKRGKEIFFGKGECSNCHMISGQGGFLGPDLTDHGATAAPDAIHQEIVKSSRIPSPGYRTAVLTTLGGLQFEGLIRNEDNFSVQLQTKDGSFRFFRKTELRSFEPRTGSLMPANYRERLSDAELNDLVSYLMSTPDPSRALSVSKKESDFE